MVELRSKNSGCLKRTRDGAQGIDGQGYQTLDLNNCRLKVRVQAATAGAPSGQNISFVTSAASTYNPIFSKSTDSFKWPNGFALMLQADDVDAGDGDRLNTTMERFALCGESHIWMGAATRCHTLASHRRTLSQHLRGKPALGSGRRGV